MCTTAKQKLLGGVPPKTTLRILGVTALGVALAVGAGSPLATQAYGQIDTTIGAWQTAGSVTLGDKTFTFGSSTLAAGTTVGFANPVGSTFTVTTGNVGQNLSQTLTYTVTINSPGFIFQDVLLDSTVTISPTTVTKQVRDGASTLLGTLTSSNGTPSSLLNVVASNLTTLQISETFDTTEGGIIASAQDRYNQQATGGGGDGVPEPASLAIWSVLAGTGAVVGLVRRRKSKIAPK